MFTRPSKRTLTTSLTCIGDSRYFQTTIENTWLVVMHVVSSQMDVPTYWYGMHITVCVCLFFFFARLCKWKLFFGVFFFFLSFFRFFCFCFFCPADSTQKTDWALYWSRVSYRAHIETKKIQIHIHTISEWELNSHCLHCIQAIVPLHQQWNIVQTFKYKCGACLQQMCTTKLLFVGVKRFLGRLWHSRSTRGSRLE